MDIIRLSVAKLREAAMAAAPDAGIEADPDAEFDVWEEGANISCTLDGNRVQRVLASNLGGGKWRTMTGSILYQDPG